jgi:hypothetical protein
MLANFNYDKIFQGVDKSTKKSWPLKWQPKSGHCFLMIQLYIYLH